MNDLTYTDVAALLQADLATGALVWRSRPAEMFPNERSAKVWNSRFSGKPAFTAFDRRGYRVGAILGRHLSAHRVIWLLYSGEWPASDIDHVNGDRSDNRIANLRSVTHAENLKNQKTPANNKSGAVGVSWCKTYAKWLARIKVGGSLVHLGYFREFGDAVSARKAAELEYGFHQNHGR